MDKPPKVKTPKTKTPSYGGQALLEGVMMRGGTSVALAVQSEDGDILLDVKRLKRGKRWYNKIPVLRGIAAFGDSLISGVKTLAKSAEVSAPEEEKIGKGWMGFAMVLGLALGIGLFFVVPLILNTFLIMPFFPLEPPENAATQADPNYLNLLWSTLIEGFVRIAIFILYLFAVSLMKDIRRTFMYHGAEHRTINCFEKGMELNVKNVQSCSTRHNRCGTTFLFFVMVISILVLSLARVLFALWGISAATLGGVPYFFVNLGIKLGMLPIIAGLSYELLKFLAKLPDNWFTFIFRAPGLALQRLTTYPPDDAMAEVALAAFNEAKAMDDDPGRADLDFGQFRYKNERVWMEKVLAEIGAESTEADWIFCDVTGYKRSELREIKILTDAQHKKIKEILERRKTGEPLWHILGYCDFYGERVIVNRNALIPRAETEILCEATIKQWSVASGQWPEEGSGVRGQGLGNKDVGADGNPPEFRTKILDLCTGSGCIARVLSKKTDAKITASDVSGEALSLAANNLEGTRVEIVLSDLFDSLQGRSFDIIVCNPPYIASSDIDTLQIEVKSYEPLIALDGGADGLDFYRRIIAEAPAHLNPGGCILFEVGYNQAEKVAEMLNAAGIGGIKIIKDLSGIDRVVKGILGAVNVRCGE
ncbi:MAG: peptide chain release factor N(5)-glutamine methyltransferase [Firmicutes bacterium]|nr:peptide chain release factor N(5)-glutamine methyltransferase [Bacillota bacterium]